MLRRRGGKERPAPQWSRQKMLALLIGVGVTGVVLVFGLVLAVVYAVHPARDNGGGPTTPGGGNTQAGGGGAAGSGGSRAASDPRDALADKAMPQVDEAASHPSGVSSADPGVLMVPAATANGPAQVPTGFPHTAAGALAQLAAIDQVAMQSGSLAGARTVIQGWATTGGPTASSWSVVQGLGTLFDQLGLSGGGSGQLALVLTPLMGQLKGSVGPDFVIPCVDFELDITFQQTARGATADCQRMVWQPTTGAAGSGGGAAGSGGKAGGRWLIGAGSEPATGPSVWPDTDTAIAVGYKDLRQEPHA